MARFPVDAPKRLVIKAFELLGFRMIREREHIVMARDTAVLRQMRYTDSPRANAVRPY
jgi:hypothetical protein